ncbi:MAG: PKD domain-containing protein, partial [Sphingobacteriales bacterium]
MRRRLYTLLCIVAGMLLSEVSYGQLIANFTSNTTGGCSPILVQFTDQSTGNPTSWLWNLGNGTTSTLQNPSSTYITPGLYTVTLTVSSGPSSNTKTLTSYINVLPAPFANFVVSDSTLSCPPKTVQFTNLSIPGSTGSATYLWDFGDGTTSTASNPSHTYTTGGNYNVSLSVTNSSGCLKIKSKAQYVLVSQKPAPDFTALNNNSCSLPTTVVFTNTTIGAVSYLWDFGNGNTSTAANPTQTYVSGGSYTVRLIATNANGCKDTITKPGFVNIGPLVASFSKSSTSTCVGSSVFFTNTTTPGAGNSTWYFGDGTSATTANPSKAYTTPGTYTVKLVVNYNNCSDSTTQTIVVHPSPSAQFSATPTDWCSAPKAVQFTNLSIGASTYNWNFGNGSTAISANPTHTYTSLGSYTVTLVATSINGCKDTLVQPAYVNLVKPEVTLSFTPANSCAPSTVTLTANVVSNQPITSYFWDYGDGTSGPGGATVSHLYPNGYVTYFPKVIVNTASGCSDTSALVVLPIGAPVTAGFTATPTTICPGQTVFFTNTTTFSAGNPLYYWTFGDGSTSTLPNPSHTYTNQGVYTVTLFADNNGCTSMFTMQITVNPPFANFTPNYSCSDRKKVTFTNTSTGGTFISWDFGDGTTSSQTNPNHTYTNFGTYDVQLLVVNGPTGCTASITKKIVLFPIDAQFIADDTTVCK